MERKFPGGESSLYGLFAPRNESAEERKGVESLETLLRPQRPKLSQVAQLCCTLLRPIGKVNGQDQILPPCKIYTP